MEPTDDDDSMDKNKEKKRKNTAVIQHKFFKKSGFLHFETLDSSTSWGDGKISDTLCFIGLKEEKKELKPVV